MSLFENSVFNSTLYEALYLQIGDTLLFAKNFFESCVSSLPIENLPKVFVNLRELSFYEELANVFYFNEFQVLLLKTFLLILLFTLLLILLSWRVYGKRISERFMKPGELYDVIYIQYVFCTYNTTNNNNIFALCNLTTDSIHVQCQLSTT